MIGTIEPCTSSYKQVVWLLDGNYSLCATRKTPVNANNLKECWYWDFDVTFCVVNRYVATPGDPTYTKKTKVGTVSSYNANAYPNGGILGKYYYELF